MQNDESTLQIEFNESYDGQDNSVKVSANFPELHSSGLFSSWLTGWNSLN